MAVHYKASFTERIKSPLLNNTELLKKETAMKNDSIPFRLFDAQFPSYTEDLALLRSQFHSNTRFQFSFGMLEVIYIFLDIN